MSLATNLAKLRAQSGLTQPELAKLIGVNQSAISYFEQGKKIPSLAVAERLADVLHCSLDELVGRKEEANGRTCNFEE
ncbi:MAG: helix-turn-helix domain-containing protein [Lachnospiraceae bacterium]